MMPMRPDDRPASNAIPARAGVGLKPEHYRTILDVGFFEVHAENQAGAGGPPHRYPTEIRNSRHAALIRPVATSVMGSLAVAAITATPLSLVLTLARISHRI